MAHFKLTPSRPTPPRFQHKSCSSLPALHRTAGMSQVQFWDWPGSGKRKTHRIAYVVHGTGGQQTQSQ